MLKLALPLMALISLITLPKAQALTNSVMTEAQEFTPVVQIRSEAPDSTGEKIAGYCNATFIAKNVLVTAAHCVSLAYISKETSIHIQIGYYKYVTRPDGSLVRVGYAIKHKFDKHVNIEIPKSLADKFSSRGEKASIGPAEDFAILWWNEATPETDDLVIAEAVSPKEHAEIIKNIATYPMKTVSINYITEMSTDTKRMADLNKYKWYNGYVHSTSLSRVQEGDSGSPLFVKINNKLKVFGVVKGKATTVFSNWDVYPAVSTHLCPLNSKMPTSMKLQVCK